MGVLVPKKVVVTGPGGDLTTSNLDAARILHLDGLSVNVQQALDLKQERLQGAQFGSAPTVDRVVITDTTGRMITSTVPVGMMERLSTLDTGGLSIEELLATKSPILSFDSPLTLSTTSVSIPPASYNDSGYLTSDDYALFAAKQDPMTSVNETRDGYLTSFDFIRFGNKQDAIVGAATSILERNLDPHSVVTTDSDGKVETSSLAASKLLFIATARSDLQAQIDGKQRKVEGAASTALDALFTPSMVVVTNAAGRLMASAVQVSSLSNIASLKGNVQDQLDSKQPLITGACTSVVSTNLPGDSIVITTSGGKLSASAAVNAGVLANLSGLTGNIQAQIDSIISGSLNSDALGFYGSAPVAKPVVSGSRGGNAALTSLIAALVSLGLISNSTTP